MPHSARHKLKALAYAGIALLASLFSLAAAAPIRCALPEPPRYTYNER